MKIISRCQSPVRCSRRDFLPFLIWLEKRFETRILSQEKLQLVPPILKDVKVSFSVRQLGLTALTAEVAIVCIF